MAILQVRDLDDRLYNHLKERARKDNRSISQEVIVILEQYLSNPGVFQGSVTKEFLELSSSWDDERSAAEIIREIKTGRKNKTSFGAHSGLFD